MNKDRINKSICDPRHNEIYANTSTHNPCNLKMIHDGASLHDDTLKMCEMHKDENDLNLRVRKKFNKSLRESPINLASVSKRVALGCNRARYPKSRHGHSPDKSFGGIVRKGNQTYNLHVESKRIKATPISAYDVDEHFTAEWHPDYNRPVGDIGRKLLLKEIRDLHSKDAEWTNHQLSNAGLDYSQVRFMRVHQLYHYMHALGEFEYALKVSLEFGSGQRKSLRYDDRNRSRSMHLSGDASHNVEHDASRRYKSDSGESSTGAGNSDLRSMYDVNAAGESEVEFQGGSIEGDSHHRSSHHLPGVSKNFESGADSHLASVQSIDSSAEALAGGLNGSAGLNSDPNSLQSKRRRGVARDSEGKFIARAIKGGHADDLDRDGFNDYVSVCMLDDMQSLHLVGCVPLSSDVPVKKELSGENANIVDEKDTCSKNLSELKTIRNTNNPGSPCTRVEFFTTSVQHRLNDPFTDHPICLLDGSPAFVSKPGPTADLPVCGTMQSSVLIQPAIVSSDLNSYCAPSADIERGLGVSGNLNQWDVNRSCNLFRPCDMASPALRPMDYHASMEFLTNEPSQQRNTLPNPGHDASNVVMPYSTQWTRSPETFPYERTDTSLQHSCIDSVDMLVPQEPLKHLSSENISSHESAGWRHMGVLSPFLATQLLGSKSVCVENATNGTVHQASQFKWRVDGLRDYTFRVTCSSNMPFDAPPLEI